MYAQSLSCVSLWFLGLSLPGSSVHGIFQQEYWSGLPFPLPGNLPEPGVKPESLVSLPLTGRFFTTSTTWEAPCIAWSASIKICTTILWYTYAAAAAKSLQSCLTLYNPRDGSPPGSPIPGILQARTLEWVAISFSKEWKWKVKVKSLSHVRLFTTPWTVAYQAPPSMGFSRQEYWSGLPLPSPIPMQ